MEDEAMTDIARHGDFAPGFSHDAASHVVATRPGLLRRMFDAVFESCQRQADREIAEFLARSGGRFTDGVEREMTQRLFKGSFTIDR
jgi:hypothetical protein